MLPVYLDGEKDPAANSDPEAGESAPKSLLAAALLSSPDFVQRTPGALISGGEIPAALTHPASVLPADLAGFSDPAVAELNA